MDKITVKNLPEQKLSYVILKVIEDVARVIKFGYTIDMSEFVHIDENKCAVCLGGAAVMGFVPDERMKGEYDDLWNLVLVGVNEGISEEEERKLRNLAYTFDSIREGDIAGAIENWNHVAINPIPEPIRQTSNKIVANLGEWIGEYGTTEFNHIIEGAQLDRLKDYLLALSNEFEKLGY